MNARRWKCSLLIAAVGLLIGKTSLFAQQTDPALTSAVLGQTAALKKIHKDRKKTQEKIIAAEVAVTASWSGFTRWKTRCWTTFRMRRRHAEPLPD